MEHPILSGPGRKIYFTAWAVIMIAQAFVLYYFYNLSLALSISDAIVYSTIFFIMGVGYWYVIRYANPDKNDLTGLVSVHFLSCFITVSIWIYLARSIMKLISGSDLSYQQLDESGLVARIVIGTFFYIVIMLGYYLVQYNQGILERDAREYELRSLLKLTELKALKSQIQPHFIFNSLNSISSLTLSAPDKAREMVIMLSDFLRYSLTQDENTENTLSEELAQVIRYLDIEKVRFGDRLIFENKTDSDSLLCKVPKLILQPLFENAVKYGVYESVDPVTITLESANTRAGLLLTVSNNYDPDSRPKKGEGIGLKNIGQRLGSMFGMDGLMQVSKKNNIFTVRLNIPQKQ